jgi:8'-apo-carotenoid 13,14-cleaving dioxygenase
MDTTIRSTTALMSPAPTASHVRRNDTLAVSGVIPAELHGRLLRTIRHPGGGDAPALESGIRISEGGARWHRAADGDALATCPGPEQAENPWLGQDGAPPVYAATARFLVVFDLPVVHRPAAALIGERLPYRWQEGRPARIGLLERWADQPRWFDIRPCYVFNAVNAYDDRHQVIIDAIRHERAFDPAGDPATPPALWRWTLDLRTGAVTERQLSVRPQESPEVDPRVRGRRHRYIYSACTSASALVRHDVVTGRTIVRELGPGMRVEQPVFVARPGTSSEGSGWVLAVVHDFAASRSDVIILNAEDLCGPPVATVHLPVRLPTSLHTRWQPSG